MNGNFKNFLGWVLAIVFVFLLVGMFEDKPDPLDNRSIPYSEFLNDVDSERVEKVLIVDHDIRGFYKDGTPFKTYSPGGDPTLLQRLYKGNVQILSQPKDDNIGFWQVFLSWFPTLLFIGIWVFFWRQMQGNGNKAMGFGKSKAKMQDNKAKRVTFSDVAGIDEAKGELEEIVDFLKDPKKFQRLGGQIPKGVLLIGPPGTGKTLLARAIAGEAGVPFFSISGSEFVEMFVGVGASRVRDMFEKGKKNAPCIIFIDEIDAVGRHRGFGLGGGNDEREQTLNQLLVEMDGFESNDGVIIISATNRPDVLDPALLRPGRFDRQVTVPNPDLNGRINILKVHLQKVKVTEGIDITVIARGTPGFSGADLANLVNEAALIAARRGKLSVGLDELENAKDKIMMGAERRSFAMSDDEKKITAYHEGGHALTAILSPDSDPVHKATIIPRGMALGLVMRLPERDKVSVSKAKLYADLCVAMGGRIAEEILVGGDYITTGASSDIRQATNIARRMVIEWGMSPKLGFLSYSEDEGGVFLGHKMSRSNHISEKTSEEIDAEIRVLVDSAYAKTKALLTKYKPQLKVIAEALLEYETLTGTELKLLFDGKKIDRKPEEQPIEDVSIPMCEGSGDLKEPAKEHKKATDKKSDDGKVSEEPEVKKSDDVTSESKAHSKPEDEVSSHKIKKEAEDNQDDGDGTPGQRSGKKSEKDTES